MSAILRGEIQRHVVIGQAYGLGRTVHRVDQLGATAQGIDRKTARVAEHVQHPSSLAVMLQQTAVLALIDKESGLLSLEPIDVEAQTVFQRLVGLHVSDDVIIHGVEVGLVGKGSLALVIDVAHARQLDQCLGDDVAGKVHAGRVGLHHGRGAINVHHQAWQEVALAVHEAVGVVVLALQPQGLSHAVRVVEPLLVERLVDGRVVKGEHPHGNAPDLAVSVADEGAVVGIDGHQVALVDGIVGSGNGPREHPGMETLQGVFLAALESYGFIGHILVSSF